MRMVIIDGVAVPENEARQIRTRRKKEFEDQIKEDEYQELLQQGTKFIGQDGRPRDVDIAYKIIDAIEARDGSKDTFESNVLRGAQRLALQYDRDGNERPEYTEKANEEYAQFLEEQKERYELAKRRVKILGEKELIHGESSLTPEEKSNLKLARRELQYEDEHRLVNPVTPIEKARAAGVSESTLETIGENLKSNEDVKILIGSLQESGVILLTKIERQAAIEAGMTPEKYYEIKMERQAKFGNEDEGEPISEARKTSSTDFRG